MPKYIFVKVNKLQCISACDGETALQTAFKKGTVKIDDIDDYLILRENDNGGYSVGKAELEIDWN